MNFKKVIYVFFTLMSLTTIAGFLYDQNAISLFIAATINIISTMLKIGVNNTLAAEQMSGSLVADLHLIPAFILFTIYGNTQASIALVIGAVIATVFSALLILIESSKLPLDSEEY